MDGATELHAAIDRLGIAMRPVCVHASMRSFGALAVDADALIDALLMNGCTVLVPTFTYMLEQPPPPERRYPQNGWDYARYVPAAHERRFEPADRLLSRAEMGALPAAVLAREGRVRGRHPLNSFAALGPLARPLIEAQTPIEVYAPLERLCDENGAVLLAGVGLTSATLIHLAESDAGRRLFRRWARTADGAVTECRVGSCSAGFEQLALHLGAEERRVSVGESLWRCYDATMLRRLAAAAIRADPMVTHCGRAWCARCRDATSGGPRFR